MLYSHETNACFQCMQIYLMDYITKNNVTEKIDVNLKLQNFISNKEVFYPHPSCGRHSNCAYPKASNLELDVGEISPFNKALVKDLNYLPNLPYICVVSSSVSANPSMPLLVGRGVDYSKDQAMLKAKMEVLERICAYYQPRTRFQFGVASNFDGKILEVHKHLNHERRWWVESSSLSKKETFYIPMEYCQLESMCNIKNPIVKSSSAGMSIHNCLNKGMENSLFEISEKIAINDILISKPSCKYDANDLSEKHASLVEVVEQLGYEIIILYKENNKIHNFLILMVNVNMQSNKPALVLGAGSNINVENALDHAILEAYSQLIHALEIYSFNFAQTNKVYEKFLFYFKPKNARKLLDDLDVYSLEIRSIKSIKQDHITFSELIKDYGDNILYVYRGNILTDYLGLYAIQVLIPDIYPFLNKEKLRSGVGEW
jgi:YcaO-like protein with predicted kinase domain